MLTNKQQELYDAFYQTRLGVASARACGRAVPARYGGVKPPQHRKTRRCAPESRRGRPSYTIRGAAGLRLLRDYGAKTRAGGFYESTHCTEFLGEKTELLVGLSAAIAMNCYPCIRYYLLKAKAAGVKKGEVSEVLAKVMAVAAGQKRLQFEEVISKYDNLAEHEGNL